MLEIIKVATKGYAIRPLIISLLRLVIFVFPIAYLFTLSDNVTTMVWWTLPIAEVLTAIISLFILKKSYKKYRIVQDKNYISDFDELITETKNLNNRF